MVTHIHSGVDQGSEDFSAFHNFASREVKRHAQRHRLDSAEINLLVPRRLLRSFTGTVEHEILRLAGQLGVRLTWVSDRPDYLFRLEGSTEIVEARW